MQNGWSEAEAANKDEMELLVYQSRLIGADTSLVVWGGGNTSIKTTSRDFRGQDTSAMTVKGSGSDLKTIEPKHFPSLRLDDVLLLFGVTARDAVLLSRKLTVAQLDRLVSVTRWHARG